MDFSAITGSILAALGGQATYAHSVLGATVALDAVIAESVDVVDESGQIVERVRVATVRKSVLAGVPVAGDTLTVDDRIWVVQRMLSDDGYALRLVIT